MPSSPLSVLIAEDDRALAITVSEYLAIDNVSSDFAEDGSTVLNRCAHDNFDVIVLDVNLPKLDGLAVCQRLRDLGNSTPVLMLTARDTIEDKVAGFEAGADDYLIKPFVLRELHIRIRALAHRRMGRSRAFVVGNLQMTLADRHISRAGKSLNVSPTGWLILEILMRASPEIVSRDVLLRRIWGEDLPETDNLKVQLFNLRQVVDKPFETPLIHTIAGAGYCLREEEFN